MKFALRTPLLIAVFALLAVLLTSCMQPQTPTAVFDHLGIRGISLEKADLDFVFQVTNPNPIGVDSAKYDYTLSIEGLEVLKATDVSFSLPANETRDLTLPVPLYYAKVFGTAEKLIQKIAQGSDHVDYQLQVAIKLSFIGIVFTLPVSSTGQLPLPKIPSPL
jgi:LEA14-like dessication related protein